VEDSWGLDGEVRNWQFQRVAGPTKLTRARVGIAKVSSWVLDFAIPKVEDGRV